MSTKKKSEKEMYIKKIKTAGEKMSLRSRVLWISCKYTQPVLFRVFVFLFSTALPVERELYNRIEALYFTQFILSENLRENESRILSAVAHG